MKTKNLILIFCMFLLVLVSPLGVPLIGELEGIGFVSAANYRFENTTGTTLATIYGDFGNLSVLGNISTDGYFIGDGSYLTNLNSSLINQSIVNYWAQSGTDLYYNSGNVGIGVLEGKI